MIKKLIKSILCIILSICCVFTFTGCAFLTDILKELGIYIGSDLPEIEAGVGNLTGDDIKVIGDSEFSIHFLEVGNKYTGDCTYIKAGDNDILIDAGSRKNSAETIITYVNQFCTDRTLEYVIATHAHQDHIAGFVGLSNSAGIFDYYTCETIIDYAKTNATSSIKEDYEALRDLEVANENAKHYTALECYNNKNGASREYKLSENVTMKILYQKFYEEETSDENDYSVCLLFTYGEENFLLTGDLEHEGEQSLVESNNLPKCKVFKGGHHGSPTSNTPELLSIIKPEIVCVCCCCGSDEYTSNIANMFPSQQFVNNVAPYTDAIYVTTIVSDDGESFQSMNGNIIIYFSEIGGLQLRCTNDSKKFKDTAWFKQNRIKPSNWE
jgi:beta-lactamase superfamily II metal-dependent hydrolase